jgi:Kef-type K+ transport system membrane component KefB
MTPLLSIILLFLIAYAGFMLYQKYGVSRFWLKLLVDSGSIHLFIGVLVGPHLLQLLSVEILGQLNFLIALVLGWAGFLIGLQVKIIELKRFQKSYFLFSSTFFISSTVLLLIFLISGIKLNMIEHRISEVAFLGLLGAVSSPILIGVIKSELKIRGTLIHLLQFSVALDNVFAVTFLGIFMIIINPYFGFDTHSILIIFGALIFSSVMAWMFYKISKNIRNDQQYFLLLIGFLLTTVGVSLNIGVSMLFLAFVFGVVLTNLPASTRSLYHSIASAERPLYYLLVIFAGASIGKLLPTYFLIALVFIVLRFLSKIIAGYISRQVIIEKEKIPANNGLAHIGMGGVALAMVLDYHLAVNSELSEFFIFLSAISVLGNVLISSSLLHKIKQ